jgi:hypothetical protein
MGINQALISYTRQMFQVVSGSTTSSIVSKHSAEKSFFLTVFLLFFFGNLLVFNVLIALEKTNKPREEPITETLNN